MAILFFFLCISVTSLVRCDDNVAMESGVSYHETYKVHPDPEEAGQFHSVKESQGNGHNQFQINVQKLQYLDQHHGDQKQYQYQYLQQHGSSPESEGHTTLAEVHGVEEVQPISHNQNTQQHHSYQHVYHSQRPHQPTRIKGKYNSQASQVKHINEKEGHHKALGFSSYVEHVSDKDEEAAIKEGSLGDIKRLVPKSGISFKIYHNDKETGSQKTHHSSHSYQLLSGHGKEESSSHGSSQHQKFKVEVPVTPVSIHHDFGDAKGSQYYLKDQTIDHEIENIQPNIGVVGNHDHEYHNENLKETYLTQIEGSSQKPPAFEYGGKTSVLSELKSSNHGSKATSTVEFNKNLNIFSGHKSKAKEGFRKEITKFQYKKPHYSGGAGKAQISLRKPLKHLSVTVKPTEAYHLDSESHTGEKITQSHVQQLESGSVKEGLSSYISHTTGSPQISIEEAHGVHFSHSTASPHVSLGGHQGLITHSTAKPLIEFESGKEEHSGFTSHLSTSHGGLEGLKTSHAFIGHTKVTGVEESKGDLHGIITHSTASPPTSFHETYSHSTASPIKEFEAVKDGHITFHTQLSSSSHEGVEHNHNYVSHLPHNSQLSADEGNGGHASFISHSAPLQHEHLDSLKSGQVSYHSTAAPLIDFKSPKEGLSSYASYTTSSPHTESFGGGSKTSVPSSHISFELGKGGYHTEISHTAAAPLVSIEGSKENHLSVISHTTALPPVSLESNKGGYITHTTPKPLASFESSKGGYITHTTAIPHVTLEPIKVGYFSHTTSAPHASFESTKLKYISHTTASPHLNLESLKDHTSYLSHSVGGSHELSHSTASPLLSIKGGHGSIISHTTSAPHVSLDISKLNQHESPHSFSEITIPKLTQGHFVKHLTTNTYLDSEALKGNEHNTIIEVDSGAKGPGLTHVPINTYIDAESTKTGQKNFDHQKALEGSTSFDFKNAIGSAEPLTHQVQITPSHVENLGKQTLTYLVPKIPVLPTAVPIVDNHIQETVLEKQPTKHFAYGGLTSKYPVVTLPELSGKYLSSPHTIMWTSEHLKHGNALTSNEFHQPLVNLHLPKQELLKLTKLKQVEIPTSYISHQSTKQQKAPLVVQHETPVLKYAPELHFPKKVPQVQHIRTNHMKSIPIANIDWSLYKSMVPNFNMNTILLKPELMGYMHEPGKKIIPILVKKRKNRSSKDVEGIIYGKTTGNRGPVKPNHRNDKAIRGNPQQTGNRIVAKGNGNNEFSVSASYKVDRSLQTVAE